MKSGGGNTKITPLQLLHEGKMWLEIWENIPVKDKNLRPAIYCLFTALEFYMKAYLLLKNSKYANTEKLKKIGHGFKRIYEEIVVMGKNKLTNKINTQIKKYELEDIALDKLKYPEIGRVWILDHGIEEKKHTLGDVFQCIDNEVSKNFDQWLIDTYPKKTHTVVFFHINYKGNSKNVDLEALSNTCSECLPPNLIISEEYDYPWQEQMIYPQRNCASCNNLFDPNGLRESFWE